MEISGDQGEQDCRYSCRAKGPDDWQIYPKDHGDGADRDAVTRGKRLKVGSAVEGMEAVRTLKNKGRLTIGRPSPTENKFQPAINGLRDSDGDDAQVGNDIDRTE